MFSKADASGSTAPRALRPRRSEAVFSSSSLLACFIVLKLDFQAGTSLERNQYGADLVLIDFKYQRLLFTLLVAVADGEEMLPLFREQEQRRDRHGHGNTPVDVLPVLDEVDLVVFDINLAPFAAKLEKQLVGGDNPSRLALDSRRRGTSDVGRPGPVF